MVILNDAVHPRLRRRITRTATQSHGPRTPAAGEWRPQPQFPVQPSARISGRTMPTTPATVRRRTTITCPHPSPAARDR